MIRTLIIAALLAALAAQSHAGYAQLATPPGWSMQGSTVYYGGSAANSPWINGTAAGAVTTQVAGRAVTMPMSARVAANAASVAVSAIRLNPAGLATGFVATWLLDYGLSYVNGQWLKAGGGWTLLNVHGQSFTGGSALQAGQAAWLHWCRYYNGNVGNWQDLCAGRPEPRVVVASACSSVAVGGSCDVLLSNTGGLSGQTFTATRGNPVQNPAVEADWSAPAAASTLPDNVLNQLRPTVPLPVQVPAINPDAAGVPQPLRVPAGLPLPVPNTSPQEYRQPVVDVYPRPGYPFQADLQPKDVTSLDPIGVTDPVPITGQTPQGAPLERVEVVTCGLPDSPPCKIDEAGTPTAGGGQESAVWSPANTVRDQAFNEIDQKVKQPPGAPGGALPWVFTPAVFGLPTAQCTPFVFGARSFTMTIDVCSSPLVNQLRAGLAWLLFALTALYVWRRVNEAPQFAGA